MLSIDAKGWLAGGEKKWVCGEMGLLGSRAVQTEAWLMVGAGTSGWPSPPQCYSPGTEPAGSMETNTDVSSGTGLPTTRHTYSPESAGDTWCSLSSEPWVCRCRGEVRRCLALNCDLQPAAISKPRAVSLSAW